MTAASLSHRPIRLAVRAVIVQDDRLLLVNAWPDGKSDLLCAPGGGADSHAALPDNLARELHEETGLRISVGQICLVNEFHDPDRDFHQVDIYFWAQITAGEIDPAWKDPEAIVTDRIWVTKDEMRGLNVKPDSLIDIAFGPQDAPVFYDPLEPIVR
ncbi:MAG: NUDIX hydrolase [Aliishimia sp.]